MYCIQTRQAMELIVYLPTSGMNYTLNAMQCEESCSTGETRRFFARRVRA
jgi:hypothetical protein